MFDIKLLSESHRTLSAKLIMLLVWMVSIGAQAGTLPFGDEDCVAINPRPLSDFSDGQTPESNFFLPLPDNVGNTDAAFETFALIDYRGAFSDYVKGTGIGGRLLECVLVEGGARVSLILNTHRALGFAQSIEELADNNFVFDDTPTIFGTKPSEVVMDGAKPSLGWAKFRVMLTLEYPGAPIPDFVQLFNVGDILPNYIPLTLELMSKTNGKLPDGSRARMVVHQRGFADEGDDAVTYTKEVIDISPIGK